MVLTKYFEGHIPSVGQPSATATATLEKMSAFPEKIGTAITHYRFREASKELMNLARLGNKYLADEEPWKKIKTDPEAVAEILHTALQISAF